MEKWEKQILGHVLFAVREHKAGKKFDHVPLFESAKQCYQEEISKGLNQKQALQVTSNYVDDSLDTTFGKVHFLGGFTYSFVLSLIFFIIWLLVSILFSVKSNLSMNQLQLITRLEAVFAAITCIISVIHLKKSSVLDLIVYALLYVPWIVVRILREKTTFNVNPLTQTFLTSFTFPGLYSFSTFNCSTGALVSQHIIFDPTLIDSLLCRLFAIWSHVKRNQLRKVKYIVKTEDTKVEDKKVEESQVENNKK